MHKYNMHAYLLTYVRVHAVEGLAAAAAAIEGLAGVAAAAIEGLAAVAAAAIEGLAKVAVRELVVDGVADMDGLAAVDGVADMDGLAAVDVRDEAIDRAAERGVTAAFPSTTAPFPSSLPPRGVVALRWRPSSPTLRVLAGSVPCRSIVYGSGSTNIRPCFACRARAHSHWLVTAKCYEL